MFHLASYFASALAAVANTDIPAIQDGYLPILNNHYVLPQTMMIFKARVGSATCVRSRLDSPSIRLWGNPHIRPISTSLLPGNAPPVMWLNRRPFVLPPGEEIAVQSTATGVGENHFALLWLLASAPDPIGSGPIFPVRFTSTTAVTANAWTLASITMDQALPSGKYSMVFSELYSTNGIAHRWLFDAKTMRPGHLSGAAESGNVNILAYQFPLGKMGEFINTALPRLEVLANGADASHTGYMWLQPMSTQTASVYPSGQPMLSLPA